MGTICNIYDSNYGSTCDSYTILDPPAVKLLLYSNDMVQELTDGLGEECEQVLLMEKAEATGKPTKPSKPTEKAKKDQKEEKESKN